MTVTNPMPQDIVAEASFRVGSTVVLLSGLKGSLAVGAISECLDLDWGERWPLTLTVVLFSVPSPILFKDTTLPS